MQKAKLSNDTENFDTFSQPAISARFSNSRYMEEELNKYQKMVSEDLVCLLDRNDVVNEHLLEPQFDPGNLATANMLFSIHNFDKPNMHMYDDGLGMYKLDPEHSDSNKEVQNQIRNTLTNNYSAFMKQLA